MTIAERLELCDADLFMGGACHIFAVELRNAMRAEGFHLRWTKKSRVSIGDTHLGSHVYCVDRNRCHKVDISGVEPEQDYLRRMNENRFGFVWTAQDVSQERLFLANRSECGDGILRTSERLLIDAEFLRVARQRARNLILENLHFFRVRH